MFYNDRKFLVGMLVVLIVSSGLYLFFSQKFFSDECFGIQDPYLKEKCYRDKALSNKDPSICDKIENKEGCDACRKEVEDILAPELDLGGGGGGGDGGGGDEGGGSSGGGETELPQGCDSIEDPDEKDWCYRNEALEKLDVSICLKIIDDYYRDSCYRYFAIKTGDPSYCDYMEDRERRQWCHELFIS